MSTLSKCFLPQMVLPMLLLSAILALCSPGLGQPHPVTYGGIMITLRGEPASVIKGVDHYIVRVWNGSTFSKEILTGSNRDNVIKIPQVKPGEYAVKVKAVDANGDAVATAYTVIYKQDYRTGTASFIYGEPTRIMLLSTIPLERITAGTVSTFYFSATDANGQVILFPKNSVVISSWKVLSGAHLMTMLSGSTGAHYQTWRHNQAGDVTIECCAQYGDVQLQGGTLQYTIDANPQIPPLYTDPPAPQMLVIDAQYLEQPPQQNTRWGPQWDCQLLYHIILDRYYEDIPEIYITAYDTEQNPPIWDTPIKEACEYRLTKKNEDGSIEIFFFSKKMDWLYHRHFLVPADKAAPLHYMFDKNNRYTTGSKRARIVRRESELPYPNYNEIAWCGSWEEATKRVNATP